MIFVGIGVLLAVAYLLIIGIYLYYWNQLPEWFVPKNFIPHTKVSVIIPARNEADNILSCIYSILNQNYPSNLLEIIVIDDFSTDNTAELVRSLNQVNVKLIQLKDVIVDENLTSYKKKALEIAISKSNGDFILTTDADCITPSDWLVLMTSFYEEHQYKFIAAPVIFYNESSLFQRFQSLDFMGMMGVSGAGVQGQFMNMCNGANLGYEKEAFYQVGGFTGIDHLASGDDMLLMQKMSAQFPNGVGYLKNKNAVKTKAKSTFLGFYNQRIRWASKSGVYPEKKITLILGVVFLWSWYLFLGLPILYFFPNGILWYSGFFLTKLIADFIFLKKMSLYFEKQALMYSFFPSFILHLIYIIIIGTLSQLTKEYEWKGRKTT